MSSPTVVAIGVGLLLTILGVAYTLVPPERRYAPAVSAQGATSLSVADCTEIDDGGTVNVDILVRNVNDLLAWEIYFAYDRDLLEVVGRDVRQFLASGPNSNVFDVSDPVPNSTGLYRLGAADVALDAAAESGTGVLATITLRTRGTGISPAAIYRHSGLPIGPRLTAEGGGKIGDTNGDEIFDGFISSGQIAIGEPCAAVAPTPEPDLASSPFPTVPGTVVITTAPPDETVEPGTTGDAATPGATSSTNAPGDTGGTSSPTDPGTSDAPATPTDPGFSGGGQGTGQGGSSGPDNTLWAIVLVVGGLALGLGVTYAVALATRRTA